MYSLLYFIDNHVEAMLKDYPHFQMLVKDFYASKANRQISLEYIKD